MTEHNSRTVQNYLSRVDAALAGVDAGVRADIVSGIREELAGLDEPSAAARIAEMDDPALIAAEARAAQPLVPGEAVPGRTLSIIAVIVLIAGSFVVPLIGPLVGLIWVSFSTAWSRREKIIAWLVPLGAAIVVALLVALAQAQDAASIETTSPLVPGWYHLAVLGLYLVLPLEGVVLLVRANRRGWRR